MAKLLHARLHLSNKSNANLLSSTTLVAAAQRFSLLSAARVVDAGDADGTPHPTAAGEDLQHVINGTSSTTLMHQPAHVVIDVLPSNHIYVLPEDVP